MCLLLQCRTAIFVPHSYPCQYLSFINMILFLQVNYCFSLFYTVNNDEPLFVTVLHKKYPKSFGSNFWGVVHFLCLLIIQLLLKVTIVQTFESLTMTSFILGHFMNSVMNCIQI